MQIDYAPGQETEFILEWPYTSTNLPKVGIVVTSSPNFSLYSIVVFPAASSPLKHVQYVHLVITVVLTTSLTTHQYTNIFVTSVPGQLAHQSSH